MSGSMKKRHTEERTLRTRRGVASRMSLRHLPTNAGQGRPAEFSGAVAANRSTAFGASGVIPWIGAACVPGITLAGLDDSRLLRTGSLSSPPERARSSGLLFFVRPMVIG